MLARALFVILLAMNLATAMWLWLAPSTAVSRPATSDPGVAALVLLGESMASLGDASAELSAAPEPMQATTATAGFSCVEIGPFQTQSDLRQAESVLTAVGQTLGSRESVERRFRGYWVFLPASASRDRALTTARELAAAGVRDYYVVTAGDQENTISLGLFRDRSNAERRQGEMRSRGYQADMSERVEEQRVYWLKLAQPPEPAVDWRTLVVAGDLQDNAVDCGS